VAEVGQENMTKHLQEVDLTVPVQIVLGGKERQDSVACGLQAVSENRPKGINILFSLYPMRRPAPAARTIQLITLSILSSIYT
ncbi:2-C-methyl-D-erythritol 2,4-cyclodiphosphate synthase, partial [human gut metagenome]